MNSHPSPGDPMVSYYKADKWHRAPDYPMRVFDLAAVDVKGEVRFN